MASARLRASDGVLLLDLPAAPGVARHLPLRPCEEVEGEGYLSARFGAWEGVSGNAWLDIEGHFDLRHAARGRWDVAEMEHAEQPIVRRKGKTLDLQRRTYYRWLSRRPRSSAWNRGVAFDQLGGKKKKRKR